jgi:hypothetical protein
VTCGLQLGLAGSRHRSMTLSLVVGAVATVASILTRTLAVPTLLASLDLGERFTVHHKTETDGDLAGRTAAARDRGCNRG